LRRYGSRVEILGPSGQHVRYAPGAVALALVSEGAATIDESGGKVKSVRLTTPASSVSKIIGPPTGSVLSGVRFTRWEHLEGSGVRVIGFHPRSFW
jgi:hypothetical protein